MILDERFLTWDEQPQEIVEVDRQKYPHVASVLLASNPGYTPDGEPVIYTGNTVSVQPTSGGLGFSHTNAAHFVRTRFNNPTRDSDIGTSMALLVQFRLRTPLPSGNRQTVAGLGSDFGEAGNTLFIIGLEVTGEISSLSGNTNSNQGWHLSGISASDMQPHTVLLEGWTSQPTGFTFANRSWCDGVLYSDAVHGGLGGAMRYDWLCALGTRRTSDLAGELNAEVLMAAAFVFPPNGAYHFSREEAAELTRNPYSIFKQKSFIVPTFDTLPPQQGYFYLNSGNLFYGDKQTYLYQGRQYAGLPA